jgi:hypothetical protein
VTGYIGYGNHVVGSIDLLQSRSDEVVPGGLYGLVTPLAGAYERAHTTHKDHGTRCQGAEMLVLKVLHDGDRCLQGGIEAITFINTQYALPECELRLNIHHFIVACIGVVDT